MFINVYLFKASIFHPIFGVSATPSSDVDVQRKNLQLLFFKNGHNSSMVFLIPSSELSGKQAVLI